MNREIKFRAWNSKNKWMDAGPFWVDNDGGIYETPQNRYDTPHTEIESTKDLVLMQYTGLKDKNGTEIYEGDICKAPHDFGPAGFVERTFTVRWHNELGYQWNYWDLVNIEVIGNIYENPELLEAAQ